MDSKHTILAARMGRSGIAVLALVFGATFAFEPGAEPFVASSVLPYSTGGAGRPSPTVAEEPEGKRQVAASSVRVPLPEAKPISFAELRVRQLLPQEDIARMIREAAIANEAAAVTRPVAEAVETVTEGADEPKQNRALVSSAKEQPAGAAAKLAVVEEEEPEVAAPMELSTVNYDIAGGADSARAISETKSVLYHGADAGELEIRIDETAAIFARKADLAAMIPGIGARLKGQKGDFASFADVRQAGFDIRYDAARDRVVIAESQ